MAGRGTDIKLGGNKNFISDDKSLKKSNQFDEDQKKGKKFRWIVYFRTERHESRRIDNQLRGRSGRQGDPGKSLYFI